MGTMVLDRPFNFNRPLRIVVVVVVVVVVYSTVSYHKKGRILDLHQSEYCFQ